jgi:solute carrier family 25 phosphate transporter 3
MSYLYPRQETLQRTFSSCFALSQPRNGAKPAATKYQARPELYGAYSVVDEAGKKAQKLSQEAAKEFEKVSAKAQAKTGKIELYSREYYAACTFGGILACVSPSPSAPSCHRLTRGEGTRD